MEFKKNAININGKIFFYWEKNSQQEETIVLLHGFPGNHLGLIPLATNLGDDYRIIISDLPACGESPSLPGKSILKNYVYWLNDFLESLSINKAVIIGHSFGSRIALLFSITYPKKVEKLVIITPVLEVDGFIARIATLYYRIGETLPRYLQKFWLANKFFKEIGDTIIFKSPDKSIQKKIIDMDLLELKKLNQQVLVELFDEFYQSDLISMAKSVKVRSLVIASDKDEIATLASVTKLANGLAGVSFEIIQNAGHFVPLEEPLKVATMIKSWLKKSS